ncbi:unnamed protein product, partial [Porites evermanni]
MSALPAERVCHQIKKYNLGKLVNFEDLLAENIPPNEPEPQLLFDGQLFSVEEVSPLNVELFEAELSRRPDRAKVNFVLQANEVSLGGMVGPFNSTPVQNLQMSSFGVIPKKGQPGKWYLIVDLSSPQGHSVSDGIDPNSWHLQYIKIDDIIKMVLKFGPGALMAKFDIESAHRNIAVHPYVMLITWTTPCHTGFFQLSLFLILWQMSSSGFWSITMAAPANSSMCASNLHVAVFVVARLSLPLYPHKFLGPASCMVVLGIELDTLAQIDAF